MNNVKNGLSENKFLSRLLSSRKIINPKREWTILLIFFSLMLLAFLLFDEITYQKISSGEMYISVNKSELNIEVLKVDELKKLINDFELKKEKIAALRIMNLIDPSI